MRLFGWLGVLAFVGALPGCGGRTFSCNEDGGCGGEGRCEADGWCSFPDDECPSGRRYAEFSGDGLAGVCVDSSPQASSGTGGPQTGDTLGSTAGSTSSDTVSTQPEETDSTSATDPSGTETAASTTCQDGGCETATTTTTSTDTMMSTGEAESSSDETGDPMPPCPGFFDDFDNGDYDPSWEFYGAVGMGGHVMSEAGSELRWAFVPGLVEQRGLVREFDNPISSILVHASELTALDGDPAQTVMLFRENGSAVDLHLVWGGDTVQVRVGGSPVADSSTFEWVEVRFEAAEVVVSSSSNGTDFDVVTTIDEDFGGDGLQRVWLYGQTWTPAPAATTAAFDSIRVCVP